MSTYIFNYILAAGMVITYTFSDSPDRIIFLLAAVILCINGATGRVIDAIRKRKP